MSALTRQAYFIEKYSAALDQPHSLGRRKAIVDSTGAALQKAAQHFSSAVGFYAGTRLIQEGHVGFEALFVTIMTTMITSQQVGMASTFTSSLHKGQTAAANIFEILDTPTSIDADMNGEIKANFDPSFKFKDIAFR